MTSIYEIEQLQEQIKEATKIVHPDNPVAHAMTARYRHLESLKEKLLW